MTFKIPDYVINENQGTFVELAKDVAKELSLSLKIEVYPPKRTVLNFELEKAVGYFPALDVFNNRNVIKTEPFYFKRDYLFSLKKTSKDLLVPKKDKKKLKICITSGYPYDLKGLKVDYELLETTSDERCFDILKKGRSDYFLCELHTGIKAAISSDLENFYIHPKAISSLDAYFAFQDSKEGRKYAKSFSKIIKKMREDGRLSGYFKSSIESVKKYVNFGYDPTKNL